jgi:uncharacterized membrane protein
VRELKTKRLVLGSIFAALTVVFTLFIPIKIPSAGELAYIHPGDSVIYVSAYVLGGWIGAMGAALGSMLADLLAGSNVYALGTFFIKGLMAFAAAAVMRCIRRSWWVSTVGGVVCGGLIMVAGYFFYELALFGPEYAWLVMPFNLIQFAAGSALALPVIWALRRQRLD